MSDTIKAVLVSLSITQLSRKKTDKEKTKKILDDEHASADAGEWKNVLFPPKAFKERYEDGTLIDQLASVAGKARALHYELTLPWEEPWAVCPIQNADKYREAMKGFKDVYEKMTALLPGVWDDYVALARSARNGMFREDDYPTIEKLLAKYSFNFRFTPLPQSHHYITQLAQESLSALRCELEDRNEQLLKQATARLKEDILGPLQTFVERLADPKNRRFAAIVGEIGRVCERAKVLNLTNDSAVNESVMLIQGLVSKLAPNPEALQDPAIAGSVREMGTQIIQHFNTMGVRKFAL